METIVGVPYGNPVGGGNVLAGNGGYGLNIQSDAWGTVAQGNNVGTDEYGSTPVPNTQGGVFLSNSPNNTIGGSTVGSGNVVSGNLGFGIEIFGSGSTRNLILNNTIGAKTSGVEVMPNVGDGVFIEEASTNTLQGNEINGNGANGVQIDGSGSTDNVVSANYIGVDRANSAVQGNDYAGILISSGAEQTMCLARAT